MTNYIKKHNDGSIWAKGQVTNGLPEGYWKWFRKDGSLMRSGHFKKGKPVGEWITYNRKSKVFEPLSAKAERIGEYLSPCKGAKGQSGALVGEM